MKKEKTSQDPYVGMIIGKTRVQECLGVGGMGAVYKAQHIYLRKTVAIKILHPHLSYETKNVKRFLREASSAAKLESPNIVKIEDTGWDPKIGLYYILMEFVDGETLAERLKREVRIDTLPALRILDQVASALDMAHRHKIFHRDIKPANILIDKKDLVKIGDFGLAKTVEAEMSELTQTGQIMGTASYMAPEQFAGDKVDARTDIYALGVTLYQMLTGQLPFDAPTPLGFGMKKCSQDPPSPREIRQTLPPEISDIVLRMIAREPGKRYQDISELRKSIRQIKGFQTTLEEESTQMDIQKDKTAFFEETRMDMEIVEIQSKDREKSTPKTKWTNWIDRVPGRLTDLAKKMASKMVPAKSLPENRQRIPGFIFVKESDFTCGEHSHRIKEYRYLGENEEHKNTKMTFVLVPGGTFQMGSSRGRYEQPVHTVTIRSFLMSKFVVTQGQWHRVMGTKPWKGKPFCQEGAHYPAVYISWNDAQEFCSRTGLQLPAESQWEYACRADSSTVYYWGNEADEKFFWHSGGTSSVHQEYAHQVGKKKPNSFGLYDMLGNVWEWCEDGWHENYKGAPENGKAWATSGELPKVVRGGSWNNDIKRCRCTRRDRNLPDHEADNLGFRVVKAIRE